MSDISEAFRHDMQVRSMTPESIIKYMWPLGDFERFLQKDLLSVTRGDFVAYIEELRSRPCSTKTISFYLAALAAFYDYCIFEERITENPVKAIRKRYLGVSKTYSEEHTHKLLTVEEAALAVATPTDIRDKAILMLMFKTGIRKRELVSLDVDDIVWDEKRILLTPTKKRTNLIVFFDDEAAYYLGRWLKVRELRAKDDRALFLGRGGVRLGIDGVDGIFRAVGLATGLHDLASDRMEDHFSPHCCRHWFTTHLLHAGMRREYVQWLRGDAIKEAVDIYFHVDPEDVRRAYLAHIPQLGI